MNDEIEFPQLPEGVGPHEGRELELMLAGKKPLAMFSEAIVLPLSDFYPEKDFMEHVSLGTLIRRDEIYRPRDGAIACQYVYYALPHEVDRIDKIHNLMCEVWENGRKVTEDDERMIGRLLGYTDSEITAFLQWTRNSVSHKKGRPKSTSSVSPPGLI
jgi:hypothetical protein